MWCVHFCDANMKTVEEYGWDNEIRSEKLFMQMLLQNVDIVKKGFAGSSISCNTFHTNTNANANTNTSINTDTNEIEKAANCAGHWMAGAMLQ